MGSDDTGRIHFRQARPGTFIYKPVLVVGKLLVPGELTYDLFRSPRPEQEPEADRATFRINERAARRAWPDLDERLPWLAGLVKAIRARPGGRTGSVKSVLRGRQQPWLAALVHRHGPVPAVTVDPRDLDLPDDLSVTIDGVARRVRIAVSPSVASDDDGGGRNDPAILLGAYAIDPGRLLRKYLEDIAADMNDIRLRCAGHDAWTRIKQIQLTRGRSLQEKLDTIMEWGGLPPRRPSGSRARATESPEATAIAARMLEEDAAEIMLARFASDFAMYLVNLLLPVMGLEAREGYFEDWSEAERHFRSRLGESFDDHVHDTALGDLLACRQACRDLDEPRLVSITARLRTADTPRWALAFGEFALFAVRVALERRRWAGHETATLEAGTPRLFFGGRIDDPRTEGLRSAALHWTKELAGDPSWTRSPVLLDVWDGEAGVELRPTVSHRLWLCDAAIFAISPSQLDDPAALEWTLREIEHARRLQKDVHPVMLEPEDDAAPRVSDEATLFDPPPPREPRMDPTTRLVRSARAALERPDFRFIDPGDERDDPAKRRDQLLSYLENFTRLRARGEAAKDDRLRTGLLEKIEDARWNHARELWKGYVELIEDDALVRCLARLVLLLPPDGASIGWIVRWYPAVFGQSEAVDLRDQLARLRTWIRRYQFLVGGDRFHALEWDTGTEGRRLRGDAVAVLPMIHELVTAVWPARQFEPPEYEGWAQLRDLALLARIDHGPADAEGQRHLEAFLGHDAGELSMPLGEYIRTAHGRD